MDYKLKAKLSSKYHTRKTPELVENISEQIQELLKPIQRSYISVGSALPRMDFGCVSQYFTIDALTLVTTARLSSTLTLRPIVMGTWMAIE